MSNDIYPDLPGLTFTVVRSVVPPPVTILTTPSTREYRTRDAANSRVKYTLPYEFLRQNAPFAELSTLVNFYNDHGGPFDSWLFLDPDDNSVSYQKFATGSGGNATTFQLGRQFAGSNGSLLEPIFDTAGTPMITFNTPAGGNGNLMQNGTQFNIAPWGGSATVTGNTTVGPFGGTDADTIADSSSSVAQFCAQSQAIENDSQFYSFSVYVLKTTGNTAPVVALQADIYGGLTTLSGVVAIDTDTGLVVATAAAPLNVSIALLGSYWRIKCSLKNNGTGNTNAQIAVFPAWAAHGGTALSVTATGSAVFYGGKVEVGPTVTTYISYSYSESGGIVAITPAPAANLALYWSGQFYRRCRFLGDTMDAEKFMDALWSVRGVEFIQTRS